MERSVQQARKDIINVQRLLKRLEETSRKGDEEADRDYFRTLSTLSGINHAQSLLNRTSECSVTLRNSLSSRLDRLAEHYKSLHQSTQAPKRERIIQRSDIEALRPKAIPILLPEEAVILDATSDETAAGPAQPTVADDLLPLENEESADKMPRISPSGAHDSSLSIEPSSNLTVQGAGREPMRSSSTSSTTNTTQSMTTLLSHHRSEQESLTEELAQMASRLKANSLQFSDLLANDKALMEEAEQKLEGNLSGMTKERDRLKGYSKKGGVTTWFVIGAVIAVMVAWMFMFGLMRVL